MFNVYKYTRMGIRLLNKLLQKHCCRSTLCKRHLRELEGKTISVDIYNYLYRFKGDKKLVENLFVMCSMFRKYNISPIFIYDGKAPDIKQETLNERKETKKRLQQEYNELINKTSKRNYSTKRLSELRRGFCRLTTEDIDISKKLIKSYGLSYIQSVGESDPLCVELVKKNKAYACLSDDMDMIGYGCPRVLRYLSLMRETVISYNYKKILQDLDITSKDFTDLIILAGTDYGKFPKNIFLWYSDYISYQKSNIGVSFLDYLYQKNILTEEDVEKVITIRECFNPPCSIEQYPYQSFKTKCIIWTELKPILQNNDFMFHPHICAY